MVQDTASTAPQPEMSVCAWKASLFKTTKATGLPMVNGFERVKDADLANSGERWSLFRRTGKGSAPRAQISIDEWSDRLCSVEVSSVGS